MLSATILFNWGFIVGSVSPTLWWVARVPLTNGVNLEINLGAHEAVPAVDGHYQDAGVNLADHGQRAGQ